MRPKSMILIVIALGCGLIASIGISQVMENRSAQAPAATPTEKIYVALTDIPLGEALTAQMVSLEEWPKDKIPEGVVRSLEEIENKRPLTRLYPGEPILAAKLIDANKFSGASEKIPKGMRVVSVKVTMDSSASGLIYPGDRVDVLVFLKAGRGIAQTGTRTILKNITVFAVNDRTQRELEEEIEGNAAKTVSLLVKPTQVEKITLASELGKIKLSLRRSDDDTEDEADGATLADLDGADSSATAGIGPMLARAMSNSGNASPGGITDFLKQMRAMSGADADTTAKEGWVMHIHTPTDIQVYNWDDRSALPRELTGAPAELDAESAAEFSDWDALNDWENSDGETPDDSNSAVDLTDTDEATPLTE
jgi:pilus assembly protein CpaB